MSFPFLYILNSLQSSLLLTFCQVCLLLKETAEIETGTAEKSSWDQAIIRQKLGLVWRNRKKISQIIKDYFYLPFFLLIILWCLSKEKCDAQWLALTTQSHHKSARTHLQTLLDLIHKLG